MVLKRIKNFPNNNYLKPSSTPYWKDVFYTYYVNEVRRNK